MPIRDPHEQPETPAQASRWAGMRRWLYHGTFLVACAAGGGALLVWPQWVALDGARSTLEIHQEREKEFTERLDAARAAAGRLRLWEKEARRVFLTEELKRYPVLVQAIGKRQGATVLKVQVTQARPARWRSVALDRTGGDLASESAGEIRPRAVRVVLKGSFDSVYRTVTALSQQQQLFIPERWDLSANAPGVPKGEVRAEILGTVFAVQQPEDEEVPVAPVTSGTVARRVAWEGVR